MALTRRIVLAPAALALVCSACSSPRTEIIVAVDSDLSVPAELDQVTIQVTAPDGTNSSSVAALGGSNAVLPRTLGLGYESGPLGPFLVRALGQKGGSTVVTRSARVYFVLERTVLLRLDLLRACMGTVCAGDTTCAHGGCRSLDIASSELSDWTGTLPPPIGATDGGPTDAGSRPDSGPMTRDSGPMMSDSGPMVTDAGPAPVDAGFDAGVDGGFDAGFDAGRDAGTDAGCTPMTKVCNGRDDNCNSMIDEGFDLTSDLMNCGMCGNTCMVANGTPVCSASRCRIDSCDPGFDDCDGRTSTGCESNLNTSRFNCSSCGNMCGGATPMCCAGVCSAMGAC